MIGEIAALITAFLWSITSLFFASAVTRIGTFQLNVSRQLIALILLFLIITLFGINIELNSTQLVYLSLSGIVGLTFGDTFLFLAYKEIGARLSMLIMSLSPAIAAILAYLFLNEKISLIGVLGILVTLIGILIVVYEKNGSQENIINYIGILFALLASIGQGSGLVLAKQAFNISGNSINGFLATAVRLTASLIFLIPISLLSKKLKNPVEVFVNDTKSFFLTIGGSIAGPVLGITFSLVAISHTKVGIASTIMALPPVIMLPMVRYFFKEKLTFTSVLGALIAVSGVAILFLRK
ncbi:MAG: DMT family transporter [Ignavibacteria bacterium]|nr:DMT family transporter [Ignavibacteria bacterium]